MEACSAVSLMHSEVFDFSIQSALNTILYCRVFRTAPFMPPLMWCNNSPWNVKKIEIPFVFLSVAFINQADEMKRLGDRDREPQSPLVKV